MYFIFREGGHMDSAKIMIHEQGVWRKLKELHYADYKISQY